jgi:hypothetical protein
MDAISTSLTAHRRQCLQQPRSDAGPPVAQCTVSTIAGRSYDVVGEDTENLPVVLSSEKPAEDGVDQLTATNHTGDVVCLQERPDCWSSDSGGRDLDHGSIFAEAVLPAGATPHHDRGRDTTERQQRPDGPTWNATPAAITCVSP